MKKYLFFVLVGLMVACFAPRMVENVVAKQLSKQVVVTSVSPADSVKALVAKARWADKKACLKLADCYREGYGVPKDFLSMVAMVLLSDEYGMDEEIRKYAKSLPKDDEYGRLLLALNRMDYYADGDVDSLYLAAVQVETPESQAFRGIISLEKGDTIAGKALLEKAAEQGCSLALLWIACPEFSERKYADVDKLKSLAEKYPFAYIILGRIYSTVTDGRKDDKLANQYYMKADEYGMLDLTGARWLLGAYKRGELKLSKEDVRRLEKIIDVKNESLK